MFKKLEFVLIASFTILEIDPKEFDLNKYTVNSLKGCVLEVDLEYPKELQELHNDYPLALKQKVNEKCCLSIN